MFFDFHGLIVNILARTFWFELLGCWRLMVVDYNQRSQKGFGLLGLVLITVVIGLIASAVSMGRSTMRKATFLKAYQKAVVPCVALAVRKKLTADLPEEDRSSGDGIDFDGYKCVVEAKDGDSLTAVATITPKSKRRLAEFVDTVTEKLQNKESGIIVTKTAKSVVVEVSNAQEFITDTMPVDE